MAPPSSDTGRDRDERPSTNVADENIHTIARMQERAGQERSLFQRVGDRVASAASSEWAVLAHLVVFGAWFAVNTGWVPSLEPFDPYPFVFLGTMVALEAIVLTLFVLASQARLTVDAERRAHLDLQVNLLAEQEMTVVLQMLQEICAHLGVHGTSETERFRELLRRTDVTQLADQLDRKIPTRP